MHIDITSCKKIIYFESSEKNAVHHVIHFCVVLRHLIVSPKDVTAVMHDVFRRSVQGHNEGWQVGHNSPGAESPWGRQITAGGAEKSKQCHKYFLQCSALASARPQFRTWRAPNLLLAPGAI